MKTHRLNHNHNIIIIGLSDLLLTSHITGS